MPMAAANHMRPDAASARQRGLRAARAHVALGSERELQQGWGGGALRSDREQPLPMRPLTVSASGARCNHGALPGNPRGTCSRQQGRLCVQNIKPSSGLDTNDQQAAMAGARTSSGYV